MARMSIDPEIFKEVSLALDPNDQIGLWESQSDFLTMIPGLQARGDEMSALVAQMRGLHELAALSFENFTPRGWGMTSIGTTVQEEALRLLPGSGDAADAVIANSVSEAWINRPIMRMKNFYMALDGEQHLGTRGGARCLLLHEARKLHVEGRYSASVPLLLNAIEGLVADAQQGKLFFTGDDRLKIDMIEPTTLVGMSCSLKVLHALYKQSVSETTSECVMSRNGIMHGRVLGYGTKVASAKCWTLFDAVVDILSVKQTSA